MLTDLARTGVDFLDAIIDVNRFPIPEIQEMNLSTRKIGLGIMGFADALIKLGIPYESDEALRFAERVMAHIQKVGHERSRELGAEKGSFPAIGKSTFTGEMRNSTVTTIAPTLFGLRRHLRGGGSYLHFHQFPGTGADARDPLRSSRHAFTHRYVSGQPGPLRPPEHLE